MGTPVRATQFTDQLQPFHSMKTTAENAKRHHQTPDELIAQINELMSEAEAMLVGPTAGQIDSRLEEMRSRFGAIRDRVTDIYGTARRKVIDGARITDESIRTHPYESLAVALGVGVLLGAVLRRGDH